MLTVDGYENTVRNVYRISKPYIGERKIKQLLDMRKYYLDFLEDYQAEVAINRNKDMFIVDEEIEDNLSKAFAQSSLDDLNQDKTLGAAFSTDIKRQKIEQSREALYKLFSMDEKLSLIFKLVVHSIFIRKNNPRKTASRSYAGSTSGALGVIWISGADNMTANDLVEVFLHELTHHLIFIDELNAPQFDYKEMVKKENYARSAILRNGRPLDKVVHSIIVATEVVEGRKTFLPDTGDRIIHPNTDRMVKDIISACKSVFAVENLPKVARPRSRELVEKCFQRCLRYRDNPF